MYQDLASVLPAGLKVLKPAEAADQNSWTVTEAFAKKYNLTDIASLKNVTEPIIVGGNSELEDPSIRPDRAEGQVRHHHRRVQSG